MTEKTPFFDILITGGTLLTMSGDMAVVENPVIGIRKEEIVFVEKGPLPAGRFSAHEVIDATGSLILPGLINTHTHASMICFRGIADDLPLMSWLNDHIFPLERKYVSREMVYNGAMLAIAEMIQSGTTTFCDGYFFVGKVAQAAVDTGIRSVPSLGFFDLDNQDSDPEKIKKHVETAERYLGKWLDSSPLIVPALFPHSPYTCSSGTLQAIKDVTRRTGIPFITHLAETQDEVKMIKDRYGLTPVRYLESLGVLDDRTVAVHCNWPDDEEITILAKAGVKVSHNPESGMKLAAGLAPVPKLHRQGIVVGLGTDGCASNNDHDLFGEMGTAAKVHKLISMDPTVMDARTVLRMATIDGARVLGLDKKIGSIEAGKLADIIILDMDKPRLTPLYSPYSQVVYAASGDDVTTTIVHGKVLMRERRLTTIDLKNALREVRTLAERIKNNA
ncbi:MAG: amidohydrolase [Syntrophales bacterium]|nr:amidohydrolase [Syntrophales bacterium]